MIKRLSVVRVGAGIEQQAGQHRVAVDPGGTVEGGERSVSSGAAREAGGNRLPMRLFGSAPA